jgi:alpha/beta hydrolase fold
MEDMRPQVQCARLASGVALQYCEQGDPAGVPIICLHGVTDSWRSFELLFEHLPRSFRAIALSQRGHGDSDRPQSGYRARDFADDLAAFMDALARPSDRRSRFHRVSEACGSASISRHGRFGLLAMAARCAASVLFPEPPLREAKVMTFIVSGSPSFNKG